MNSANIVMTKSIPTITAAALLVFMPLTAQAKERVEQFLPSIQERASASGNITSLSTETNGTTKVATAINVPSEVQALLAEVSRFSMLQQGWDDDQAQPPTVQQMQTLEAIVRNLGNRIPLPRPMISTSGCVGLYWDLDSKYADLEIEHDGRISLFGRIDQALPSEFFVDNLTMSSATLDTLRAYLQQLVPDARDPQSLQ